MGQLQFRAEIDLGRSTASTVNVANHAFVWAQADNAENGRINVTCSVATRYEPDMDELIDTLVIVGTQSNEYRDAGAWRVAVAARVGRVADIYAVSEPVKIYFTSGFTDIVV